MCSSWFQGKRFFRLSVAVLDRSQTAQLLEALHSQDTATATSTPPGLLIANDSDSRRAHLLIHQSARLPSPAFMVTNLDASIFPVLRLPVTSADPRCSVKKSPNQLLFDRILCDVPCSGDGTLRKNVGIWKRWQPMDGNGLHRSVQYMRSVLINSFLTASKSVFCNGLCACSSLTAVLFIRLVR